MNAQASVISDGGPSLAVEIPEPRIGDGPRRAKSDASVQLGQRSAQHIRLIRAALTTGQNPHAAASGVARGGHPNNAGLVGYEE
jgi:hypothetical protein